MTEETVLKENAKKLAEALDYVGHGGYECQAQVIDDKVYCSCDHCGVAWHQYIKVFSLDPLKVAISSHEDDRYFNNIKEFENVDDLRMSVEDTMAGC